MDAARPGWIERFRAWAADKPNDFGFLLALGFAVVLGAAFLVLRPTGAPTRVQGRVVEEPVLAGGRGLEHGATITVDGRTFWLYLGPTYACHTGDVIQLDRRRTVWGVDYDVAYTPRPCSRPPLPRRAFDA